MKTILQTSTIDFIINEFTAQDIVSGKPVWVDEKNNIGKVHGYVHSIQFYKELPNGKWILIDITPDQIKHLHRRILEIESTKGEEFID